MQNLQWYDFLRLLTALLSLAAMYISARRFRKHGKDYSPRLRDLWWVLNAFFFLMIEGSLESIIFDISYGPRTLLGFIIAAISMRAVSRKQELYVPKEKPNEPNSDA